MILQDFSVRKTLILCLSLVMTVMAGNAQAPEEPADTLFRGERIMLIPFYLNNYLCDDQIRMVDANGIDARVMSHQFRTAILSHITTVISQANYDRKDVVWHESDTIFDYVGFGYQSCYNKVKSKENQFAEKFRSLPFLKKKEQADPFASGIERDEFMSVRLRDTSILDSLEEKYAVNRFLFLNQLEIITDFKGNQDRSSNDFERVFVLHYTLMDRKGKGMVGNVVSTRLPSNTQDMEEMINIAFPNLAKNLQSSITR